VAAGLGLCVLLATSVSEAIAGGPIIVVHPDNPARGVSIETLKQIYLGKKTLWEGGELISPVLPEERSETTRQFIEGTLEKTLSQYRSYWRRRLFSGGGVEPRSFRGDSEILDFVAKNPGAIALVENSPEEGRVKVVAISDEP